MNDAKPWKTAEWEKRTLATCRQRDELADALRSFLDAFDLDDLAEFTGDQVAAILKARSLEGDR